MPWLMFASAVFCLFFLFVQVLTKKKSTIHYCMITACAAASLTFISFWAGATGLSLRAPAFAGSDIVFTFLAAPAFYLASLTVLYGGIKPVRKYWVYYIIPGILALAAAVYNALTAPSYVKAHGRIPGHFSSPILTLISLAAVLLITTALILDLLAALRLHKAGRVRDRSSFRAQVIFVFFYLAAALVLLSSFIFREERLYAAGGLLFGLIIICYALSEVTVLYVARDRYTKADWNGSDVDFAMRLEKLMKITAPYRDADLTLPRLASLLGVEPKRISYHLHARSLSYKAYLNDWRLKAVCADLIGRPDDSILDIAFRNGFNSKSSFNTLFYRKFGRTPREFRKGNRGRKSRG